MNFVREARDNNNNNNMDFTNSKHIDIYRTHHVGEILTTYDRLVEVFGCPTFTDADADAKVNAEWILEFKHLSGKAVQATVYNWKDGHIPTEEYYWHIGGFDSDAVECVNETLHST